MYKIDFLKDAENIAGLIAVLRCGDTPEQRRADAAAALGTLGDTRVVETLICAYKADPSESVKEAAHAALVDLLGADARMALSAYTVSPGELDHWLVDTDHENEVLSILVKRNDPLIAFLGDDPAVHEPLHSTDLFGLPGDAHVEISQDASASSLTRLLRSASVRPEKRAHAAQILASRDTYEETETLVRALVEDRDPIVQQAARDALQTLHGSQAESVIASYQHAFPYDDPWWVEDAWEEDEILDGEEAYGLPGLQVGPSSFVPDSVDFDGLIGILQSDSPTYLRLKAVDLLQYSTDARAIEWLLLTASQDDEPVVRAAALQILANLFPEDHEAMLLAFNEDEEEDGDWEEIPEFDLDDDEYAPREYVVKSSRSLSHDHIPAVDEKNELLPLIVGAGLLLTAILVLVYLFAK